MSASGASTAGEVLPIPVAPTELARAVAQLVTTLSHAQAVAAHAPDDLELATLVERARTELDVADEKLLALDRHRQRSAFRQAERIRARLDSLRQVLEARLEGSGPSPQDPPPASAAAVA